MTDVRTAAVVAVLVVLLAGLIVYLRYGLRLSSADSAEKRAFFEAHRNEYLVLVVGKGAMIQWPIERPGVVGPTKGRGVELLRDGKAVVFAYGTIREVRDAAGHTVVEW
ncbi:MAG: hypothetical protein JWO37_421 [Acidimicrobiales bacterium]|jgi:hypothetical protein|nr:hypothetical protein [Acidimicrobiales bacterium]